MSFWPIFEDNVRKPDLVSRDNKMFEPFKFGGIPAQKIIVPFLKPMEKSIYISCSQIPYMDGHPWQCFRYRRRDGLSYESGGIKDEKHSDNTSTAAHTHNQRSRRTCIRRQRAPVLKANIRQPCCIGRDNKMTQSVIIRLVPANKVVMPYLETRKSLSCYLVVHVCAIYFNRN